MKSLIVAASALVLTLLLAFPAAAQGAGGVAPAPIPVTGTFTDAGGAGTFAGTLTLERFASRDRALVAIARLSGTLTDAAGGTRSITDQEIVLPVTNVAVQGGPQSQAAPIETQQAQQECQILHLEFGGITLAVLGVQLSLSPIVLDLSLGGILGGVLCGLLGALGAGAPAPAQAGILNSALGLVP